MSMGRFCLGRNMRRGFQRCNGSLDSTGALSSLLSSTSPLEASNSTVQPPHFLRGSGIRYFTGGGRGIDYPDRGSRYVRRTAVNWGVRIVAEQEACVIERLGKFNKVLGSGIHLLIPMVDRIAYIHSLKEQTIQIPNQAAVTSDNVVLQIDGLLYIKIVDARRASYGVDDPIFAVTQLAQTTMRSAIGKMTLDKTFMERNALNTVILEAIHDAATNWGIMCLRYEIRDITPPSRVRETMELQAEAERRKRAKILEAEGKRQATILASEGERQAVILASEAAKMDQVNRAAAMRAMAQALKSNGGMEAASLKIAEQYVQAFNNLAQKSTTILLPSSLNDPSSLTTLALSLYKTLVRNQQADKGFTEGQETQSQDYDEETTSLEDGSDPLLERIDTGLHEKPIFSLQSPKKD